MYPCDVATRACLLVCAGFTSKVVDLAGARFGFDILRPGLGGSLGAFRFLILGDVGL